MKVIKIPCDDNTPCTVCDVYDAKDQSDDECWNVLKDMKRLIGIEWAEIVLTIIKGRSRTRDFCLIVDEVGKLKDGWQTRINNRASQFYRGTLFGDPIVGDVVLCAREWTELFGECDLAGLTSDEVERLMIFLQ